jgi:hypothetical protein
VDGEDAAEPHTAPAPVAAVPTAASVAAFYRLHEATVTGASDQDSASYPNCKGRR